MGMIIEDQNTDSPLKSIRKTLFFIGGFSQIAQVIIFREIMAASHGTELMFGIILGSWLLWTAFGAITGGILARRDDDGKDFTALKWLAVTALLSGPLLVGQILLVRYGALLHAGVPGQILSLGNACLMAFICTLPFAFLCGFQFTIALRGAPRFELSALYRTESWGAAAGGLLVSLILIELGPPIQISLITGAVFSIFIFFHTCRKIFLFKYQHILAPVTVLIVLALSSFPLDRWSQEARWERVLPGFKLKNIHDSRHGQIVTVERENSGQISVFLNGGWIASMEKDASDTCYHQLAAVICTQHPKPTRALMIGGALGRLPEQFLNHGIESLYVVELDPQFFKIASESGMMHSDNRRLKFISGDGRRVVSNTPDESFDLVVVLSSEPDNLLANRFCTKEFFTQTERILTENGVLCVVLPAFGASAEYVSSLLAKRTGAVLKAVDYVFPETLAAPISGHLIVAGKKREQITVDPDVLEKRLLLRPNAYPVIDIEENGMKKKIKTVDEAFLSEYFNVIFGGVLAKKASFMEEKTNQPVIEKFERIIRNCEVKPNLDNHPRAVLYSLALWKQITDTKDFSKSNKKSGHVFDEIKPWDDSENDNILKDSKLPESIESVRLHHVILPLLLLLFFTLIISGVSIIKPVCVSKQDVPFAMRYSILLCAFASGVFGMVSEVALMTLYQNVSGYVYAQAGIIIALFMAGIATGSYISDSSNAESRFRLFKDPIKALAAILIMTAGLCLVLTGLIRATDALRSWPGVGLIFGLLIFIAGILVGSAFVLFGECLPKWRKGRPGAWFYASDLLGACAGAVCTSTFLIPAFGMIRTLQFTAFLLFIAVIGMIPLWRQKAGSVMP